MTVNSSLLESAIKGHYEGLGARLRRLDYQWTGASPDCRGEFFYLAFRDGRPTLEEFVEYLEMRIVDFALPEDEKQEAAKAHDKGDSGIWVRAVSKAQKLFVRAHEKGYTSGEPGELTLFVLLEGFKSAPQIACKMHLKTSREMHVQGADSIHVMAGETLDTLRFVWGESKLHSSLNQGLDSAVKSVAKLLDGRGSGRSQLEREIEIVRKHLDVTDPELREALIEYFDPYSESSNLREELIACFIGFDYEVLAELTGTGTSAEVEDQFKREYRDQVEDACQRFVSRVKDKGLADQRFLIFLIPFREVRELRRRFLTRIGAAL